MRGSRVFTLAALLFFCPFGTPAQAEQILVLNSADLALYNRTTEGISGSFRADRGEQVTVISMADIADGDRLSAAELPERPDVVLTVGAAATRYATRHYPDTPIIHTMVVRPERLELTPNTIGISMFVPVEDMLATLQLISPGIRHVGVLHGPDNGEMVRQAAAGLSGFETTLLPMEVTDDRDLPRIARRLVMQSDALWIVPGTLTSLDAYRFILTLSFEHRVALVADSSSMVRAGALLSITPDPVDVGRQAARLAGYILGDEALPPDRTFYPDMANLAVNLKTARTLGINVPPMIVQFASIEVE